VEKAEREANPVRVDGRIIITTRRIIIITRLLSQARRMWVFFQILML
jgi:hypothetical protein